MDKLYIQVRVDDYNKNNLTYELCSDFHIGDIFFQDIAVEIVKRLNEYETLEAANLALAEEVRQLTMLLKNKI